MRINVYAEELTSEVEIVTRKIEDGREFFAVRLYLKSPKELPLTSTDDNRSAITFWVPWYKDRSGNFHRSNSYSHETNDIFYALHCASADLSKKMPRNITAGPIGSQGTVQDWQLRDGDIQCFWQGALGRCTLRYGHFPAVPHSEDLAKKRT